ncbi:type IX secretion system membrane protein PorP/SprF [Litoribacter ruber]|uniref:PorP/SprF family type IX secretion system membrane protein n=1 Tax=Litoribacter ruber TaxID=702568 RepID=UPI001BDB6762|nr:type IX secretion system membrane protein PorP/SprF [Litoribacter ruber]MBT0811467.1 type IX secretion system membrane protein PorP/SprF [Litoribacter ruber]
MFKSHLYIVFFTTLLLSLSYQAFGQDPQYSQYYAAPMYLNPALAGSELTTRIGLNYRNQWPGLDANFSTFSAYVDTYNENLNSGFGFHMMNDVEGAAGLRSLSLSGLYSYELRLSEGAYFRPGFQASYIRRDIGYYENLIFANQINPSDPFGPTLPGPNEDLGTPVNMLSLSFGGLFFTENFWLGGAAHHVNQPNQSFLDGVSPLPLKWSVHGGYRISLGQGPMRQDFTHTFKQRYITPTFNYKRQGPFEQLDLGAYLYAEPLIVGMWYRGLPYKPVESQSNRDAIVLLVGFSLPTGFNVGYSFDYTVSQLGIQSGGAHEISLSYIFPDPNQGKPRRRDTILPCPKF